MPRSIATSRNPDTRPSGLVRSILLGLLLVAAGSLTGCEDACSELADQICRCEPSESAQSSCLRRVDAEAGNKSVSDKEHEACQQILDAESCTCDALANGDYQACGLATQSAALTSSR